jgi:hypothetical protein
MIGHFDYYYMIKFVTVGLRNAHSE